jgi:MFS transporter, Spinster family, sphingosine-1-phosphate transporter
MCGFLYKKMNPYRSGIFLPSHFSPLFFCNGIGQTLEGMARKLRIARSQRSDIQGTSPPPEGPKIRISYRSPCHATMRPGHLLAFFCVINLLVYMDRGVISSNGVNGSRATPEHPASGIQGDFGLSLFQDGLLPAAFMVGLLLSSPAFAEASKHFNSFRLIGVGLAVWVAATAGCGLSIGFWTLLLCRMAVGVGEASFVSLAGPFIGEKRCSEFFPRKICFRRRALKMHKNSRLCIEFTEDRRTNEREKPKKNQLTVHPAGADDNAPPERKTRWLAAFFLCIPVGYAIGYIFGGLVSAALGWRGAFLLESVAMLPAAAYCLRVQGAPDLRGVKEAGAHDAVEVESHHRSKVAAVVDVIVTDLHQLAVHKVYIFGAVAATVYTAVLGALAFYGPKAGRDIFGIAPETADLAFGAVTVATGTLGTLAGGALLDAVGSSLRNALLLCAGALAVGAVLCVAAFAATKGFAGFAWTLALGQFSMFMSQAPSNAVVLWSVPPGLRPFAVSVSIVAIHMLGDVPSPPLVGLLQARLENWRLTMSLLCSLLLVGVAAFIAAAGAARTAPDYRAEGRTAAGAAGAAAEDGTGEERAASEQDRQQQPLLAAEGGGPQAPT